MPTGYTAGIIDGEIDTFQEFAKLCTRAFGATMHLRDESMTSEYKPSEPSSYYLDEINKANKYIDLIGKSTDAQIVKAEKKELLKSKEYHTKAIEKENASVEKLNQFLVKAKGYSPVTPEHVGIAEFMVNQIEITIKSELGFNYHQDAIAEIDKKLSSLSADKIRAEKIAKARKDLKYNTEKHLEDVKRCNDANKWYQDFINSVKD